MKKIQKKKRTTFAKLFVRNAVIALLSTMIFAGVFFVAGTKYVLSEAENALQLRRFSAQSIITASQQYNDYEATLMSRIRHIADFFTIGLLSDKYQIDLNDVESCAGLVAVLNDEGDILYSSRKELLATMKFSETEKSSMQCNAENLLIPDLVQFEDDYYALHSKETMFVQTRVHMTSAYINREQNTFIPHEVVLELVRYVDGFAEYQTEIIESSQHTINMAAEDGYELIELTEFEPDAAVYPSVLLCHFAGTDGHNFDELMYDDELQSILLSNRLIDAHPSGFYDGTFTGRTYYSESSIWLDGAERTLLVVLKIDAWNSVTKPLYFGIIILFLLVALLTALMVSWRRNVKNQAEYAFEDYQKALTNDLAHDLKTPLMAIGGYVENLLESSPTEAEKKRYLNSILGNVSYMDSIISRTLTLNHMNACAAIRREPVQVQKLTETGIERYALMLDERNITVNMTGQAEVNADVGMLETVIENLISNAVKYTTESGNIQVEISQKTFRIVNTVSEKIEVIDLKKPFVKGDAARSGKLGSGLGLSIADRAAAANGFQLELFCSNTEFIAVLKFRI